MFQLAASISPFVNYPTHISCHCICSNISPPPKKNTKNPTRWRDLGILISFNASHICPKDTRNQLFQGSSTNKRGTPRPGVFSQRFGAKTRNGHQECELHTIFIRPFVGSLRDACLYEHPLCVPHLSNSDSDWWWGKPWQLQIHQLEAGKSGKETAHKSGKCLEKFHEICLFTLHQQRVAKKGKYSPIKTCKFSLRRAYATKSLTTSKTTLSLGTHNPCQFLECLQVQGSQWEKSVNKAITLASIPWSLNHIKTGCFHSILLCLMFFQT